MPLHLLGKKSWNVYNSANIERVKRDEAEAKAKEEADEQRMQEEDAQRRIALLRGESLEVVGGTSGTTQSTGNLEESSQGHNRHRDRKRKRLRGEDDTDRDIRYARLDSEAGLEARQRLLRESEKAAPLHDQAGNIQLFPVPDEATLRKKDEQAEAEAEKLRRRRREEGQHSMRFSDAAGFEKGVGNAWYTSGNSGPRRASNVNNLLLEDAECKDVWGNEDPLRKERERNRITSNDPLAAMQQAQRQLKRSERDREAWRTKQRDLSEKSRAMPKSDRTYREKRRREESLDGFSLDADTNRDGNHSKHRHHHRHHGRDRDRD